MAVRPLLRARHVPAGLAVALAGLLLLFPPAGLPPQAVRTGAAAIACMGFWASGVIPEYLTALAFFLGAVLFKLGRPEEIFAGFQSTTFWLVFGGLVVGAAIQHTGLGLRIAGRFARVIGPGYGSAIAWISLACVLMSFIMPSAMGRMALLMPIASSLAERLGHGLGSRGRTGIMLAAALSGVLPAFAILPANVPNTVLAGAAETFHGVTLTYGEYLLLHFPVLGALKGVCIVALITLLYRDRRAGTVRPRQAEPEPAPMSPAERRLSALLAVSLGLWATDFLHHVSPAWVSLGAGVVCLWPGAGLLPAKAVNDRINYGSLFFVSAVLGLGMLVSASGLGSILVERVLTVLPLTPGAFFGNAMSQALLSIAVGCLTTVTGSPAVLTPLAGALADASGFTLRTTLMLQVLGFSTILLPYQSPPLLVATQLAGLSLGETTRACLILTAVSLLVLLPLDCLWLWLLGVA